MRFLEIAFEIVLSPAIVEETVRAFAYPRVRKYIDAAVDPAFWFEDVILLSLFVAGDYGDPGKRAASRCGCPETPRSSKILRDFSLPSLATGPSHGLCEAKRYPPRYPDNRDPARFAI